MCRRGPRAASDAGLLTMRPRLIDCAPSWLPLWRSWPVVAHQPSIADPAPTQNNRSCYHQSNILTRDKAINILTGQPKAPFQVSRLADLTREPEEETN
jgi:hypothetical protein